MLMPMLMRLSNAETDVFIYPYYSLGSLRDQFEVVRGLGSTAWVPLLVQVSAALTALHQAGRAHGDLKPENILIADLQPPTVVLADYERSIVVGELGRQAIIREYTDGYQAPEVAGGVVGASSDYWSLGMIANELALGNNPLDGLERAAQNQLLSTNWVPPTDRIESEYVRAFVLGCSARDPMLRWGHREVMLWERRDRVTIVDALTRSRQLVANQPFTIGDSTFSTARGLADALQSQWFAGVGAIGGGTLEHWIRTDLRLNSLATELVRLKADSSLNDETRSLRLVHFIDPAQPLTWRNHELSELSLDAILAAAAAGNAELSGWLESFIDNGVPETLARVGRTELVAAFQQFQTAWPNYESGWNQLIEAGAPAEPRLESSRARAAIYRVTSNQEVQRAIENRLDEALQETPPLLRERWFFALGNELQRLPSEHQFILETLEPVSTLETVNNIAALLSSEPRRVFYSEYDKKLTRGLVLNAATMSETQDAPPSQRPSTAQASFRIRQADLVYSGNPQEAAVALGKQVLVSWEAPENCRVQLAFGKSFLGLPLRKFRYRNLPPSGSVLVSIAETTDFWIVTRRRWGFQTISGRLRVEVPRRDRLRESAARLTEVGFPLLTPSQSLRPALERLVEAHVRLLSTRPLVKLVKRLHHVTATLLKAKPLKSPLGFMQQERSKLRLQAGSLVKVGLSRHPE